MNSTNIAYQISPVLTLRNCLAMLLLLSFFFVVAADQGEELRWAVRLDDLEKLKGMVREGADVNAQGGFADETPLHVAAKHGRLKAAQYLVSQGANVTSKAHHGQTPLHDAAWHGHLGLAKYLVHHGAPVNEKDREGYVPLKDAAVNGHLRVVQYLLGQGAQFSKAGSGGRLRAMAYQGDLKKMKELVREGANIQAQGLDGLTPLHWAAMRVDLPMAAYLLKHGADTTAMTSTGKTVLDMESCGNLKARQFLKLTGEHGLGDRCLRTMSKDSWDGIMRCIHFSSGPGPR